MFHALTGNQSWKLRRNALLQGLCTGVRTTGVRFFGIAFLAGAIASPAMAQLRTGRESDRDYYPQSSRTSQPGRNNNVTKSLGIKPQASRVVQAAAQILTDAEIELDEPGVVQAGCKNCQAGVVHSHGSIATSEFAEEFEVAPNSEPVFADTNVQAFRTRRRNSVSACDPCDSNLGGSCGSTAGVHPLDVLTKLLSRSQLRIEAATFWPDGQNLPQLVTTRRPADDPATDGLIGRTDTIALFGGREMLGQSNQGIRGEFGTYFDDCKTMGVLLRFFDAGSNSESFRSTTASEPVVMRPFFSTEDNSQSTIAINYPGSTTGTLDASISSELYGGDILFRRQILSDCDGRLEFLAGYQSARLADDLRISSTTTALTNIPVPGTISTLTDHFQTTNRFNGMALGLNGIMQDRCWSLSGMFKLGFGNLERAVGIDGASTITVPGNPPSVNSTSEGLLARRTNNGNYVDDTFVFTPEVNLTLGYRFTRQLEATIGYSYLGIPKVARVANQLDPRLEANLSNPITGALRPSFALAESDFSLHSLNYGLQWRY